MVFHSSRAPLAIFLILSLPASSYPQTLSKKKAASSVASAASTLTDRQRALHALNRLTFGPRPGDWKQLRRRDSTPGSKTSCIPRASTIPR